MNSSLPSLDHFDIAIASLPSFHSKDDLLEPLPLHTRVSSSSLLLDVLEKNKNKSKLAQHRQPQPNNNRKSPHAIFGHLDSSYQYWKASPPTKELPLHASSSYSQLSARLSALQNENFDCFNNAPSLEAFDAAQAVCDSSSSGSSPLSQQQQQVHQHHHPHPQHHFHQLIHQLCPPLQETGSPLALNGLGANDVVCARGKFMYNHPGCVRFRRILRKFIPQYQVAETRAKKSQVIDQAIEAVFAVGKTPTNGSAMSTEDEPVRFVKLDTLSGSWCVLDRQKIRDKVGHALREILHEIKRQKKSKHVRSFDHLFR